LLLRGGQGPQEAGLPSQTGFCELFGVTERCGTWRGTFAYGKQKPPPPFWRKGPAQKNVFEWLGRTRARCQRLCACPSCGLALPPFGGVFSASQERYCDQFVELSERLSDLLKWHWIGGTVRQLPFCFGFAPRKLFVLNFEFA
jgi:hypothetical protein